MTTNVWFNDKNYPMVNSNTINFYLINSVKILTVTQLLVQFYSMILHMELKKFHLNPIHNISGTPTISNFGTTVLQVKNRQQLRREIYTVEFGCGWLFYHTLSYQPLHLSISAGQRRTEH